jgi:hypothetical protein
MRTVNQNIDNASYLTEKEHRSLGYLQIDMLSFIRRNANGDKAKRFSIQRDSTTRRVAKSLERRGLIRILDIATECWMVGLPD